MRTINYVYAWNIAEGSAMQTQIILATGSESIRTLGMRASATPFRKEIERCLETGHNVAIDFSGKDAAIPDSICIYGAGAWGCGYPGLGHEAGDHGGRIVKNYIHILCHESDILIFYFVYCYLHISYSVENR